jgi:hypothetical protein
MIMAMASTASDYKILIVDILFEKEKTMLDMLKNNPIN